MQPTITGGTSRKPPSGGSGVPANTNSDSVTATALDVLEKQLLLLSERAKDCLLSTAEIKELTKAMCEVSEKILQVKAVNSLEKKCGK